MERVPDRESFARWLLAAGVLPVLAAVSHEPLLDARTLRESIYEVVRASVDRRIGR